MDHNEESLSTRDLASSREPAATVTSSQTETRPSDLPETGDRREPGDLDETGGLRETGDVRERGGVRDTGGLRETGDVRETGGLRETGDVRDTGHLRETDDLRQSGDGELRGTAGAGQTGDVRGAERSEQVVDRPGSAAETAPGTGQDDQTGPLLPTDSSADFQRRWEEIQTQFVDEPRRAVEYADGLVATVMQQLAEGFAQERERLEAQWGRGEDISTEELRVTFRRYRSFFHRLLST